MGSHLPLYRSPLVAVAPLKERINHEVYSQDANREKQRNRHRPSPKSAGDPASSSWRIDFHALESPEDFVRNLLGRHFLGGTEGLKTIELVRPEKWP